jgi:type IV secretory pathway TraG/TraD family ATPase VirD4
MNGPPTPRGTGLIAGGPNSLELLWATAAAAAALVVALASCVVWSAIAVEAAIAGTTWTIAPLDVVPLILELAAGHVPAPVATAVVAPWRPVTIAILETLALVALTLTAVRRWITWRAGWRHRRHHKERLHSPAWADRRDLRPLTASPPGRGRDEPSAEGRLWLGQHHGRDVLVPKATSVMVVAPTRTGKSTRLVIPNLLRWDGPAVVTSVKRDVLDLTATRRATFGPVALFDPTGATG